MKSGFPHHRFKGEEFGWSDEEESEWVWLVDPLDGTNNYAIGHPLYAVCITCIYRGEPLLGVIYDSHLDNMYIAEKGNGVTCNGVPLRMKKREFRLPTFAWIQGHQVQKDPVAMQLKQHLDQVCKRVLRLWAPALVWCMLARGDIDGVLLYNSEGDDLYAGLLVAREAGAITVDYNGNPFVGMKKEPYILACHPDRKEEFLRLVYNGMAKNNRG
ncbi:inositol monophosphatase family protein [Paenactinomyces guangxiensis]|uniref:inositol monophosphatase family protein n=1 Tax=Paenactinomyces guangxiensis TaxID=1490290 RepID=UPI001E2ACE76|nr:inositol monophosphatase family protein [Paenactinomyces guangxiensis]